MSRAAKLSGLPIVRTQDAALNRWLEAVAEHLETRQGGRGDPLERGATLRDLEGMGRDVLTSVEASVEDIRRELRQFNRAVSPDRIAQSITSLQLFKDLNAKIDLIRLQDVIPRDAELEIAKARELVGALRGEMLSRLENLGASGGFLYKSELVTATQKALAQVDQIYITKADSQGSLAAAITTVESQFDNKLLGYTTNAFIQSNYLTKTDTNAAIAASSQTLTTSFNNTLANYTTTATLTANYITKSDANTAIASSTNGLRTEIADPTTGYAKTATLTTNYYTKTDTDAIISSTTTNLQATSGNRIFRQTTAPTSTGSYTLKLNDVWYDTTLDAQSRPKNKPYLWNGSAWVVATDSEVTQALLDSATASSRITTVETSKIGYCTIGGQASDQVDRASCQSAGGVWNVGIPMASAVKQVSISDGATSLALEQRFTAQKTLNGTLSGQYTVKIDSGNRISGFGLASTAVNGVPTSAFIISADKFAIADPSVATSLTTAPAASLVPFIVSGGQTYIKSAVIQDGTITDAKIGSAAITSAKIADAAILSAKIADAAITSAKIGTAAITSAKIGAAEVGTLKIAGEAVTVPRTVSTDQYFDSGSGSDLLTLSYAFFMGTSGKVIAFWQGQAYSVRDAFFRMYLDGVEIGNCRIGGAFDDSPLIIGAGEVTSTISVITIRFQTDSGGRGLGFQRLVLLGAQR